jgi:golgi-specific brefeldin A-resistance guanine nucleotide exchange factor 1
MAPMVVAHPSTTSPFGDKNIQNLTVESPSSKHPELLDRDSNQKTGTVPDYLPPRPNDGKPESFKMTDGTSSIPAMEAKEEDVAERNGESSGVADRKAEPQLMGSLLIQTKSITKVIKGEVHNVLNVMRTDPRYVSPLRFMEELPMDEQHPLLSQLRELHRTISEWEITRAKEIPQASLYLAPFCDAIKGRDISAPVTGAALHAIHKFVLYGFFSKQPEAFRTIANTLLLCTFEETTPEAESRRRSNDAKGTNSHEDEQVVLKLLDLSALIVRCASLELKPDIIVGLLDTCLHVSHRAKRASSLLKSAASDALGQITLEVFSHPHLAKAREAILSKLASLLNPQKNSDAYVVNSLMLVNIALETLTDNLTETEINILQNDVCKFLLGWSTSHDLVILSLTMRVIFNLFQTISNHLKVPLEVFLTSVHLRILEHSTSNEEREVALESLLEFCQEPALMKDLYLNYDCDVNCTNLFAQICATLGEVAGPSSIVVGAVAVEIDKSLQTAAKLNGESSFLKPAMNGMAEVPMNALSSLAVEGLLTIIESIARRVKASSKDKRLDRTNTTTLNDALDEDAITEQLTEEEYQEKKRQKLALSKLAEIFNSDATKSEWMNGGKDLGFTLDTPEDVASALFQAPGVDKTALGQYLGKGPAEKYPFEDKVRRAFVAQIDFTTHNNFAKSLRVFLHKFRMPGEAQCIDRFMDAFAAEFFKQQGETTSLKSVDATYVLAFSTIMLNTDLHNPMNKTPRMTCEQFISNNRGINDGEDIPVDMLSELYEQIKENEIQVQQDLGEFISLPSGDNAEHFRAAWGELLSKQVAAASFTPAEEAIKTINQAGIHEKDMFLVIAKPALQGIGSAFVRTWDDGCILSCLKGLEQMARIATYFNLDNILNDVMALLLVQGKEFIAGCISLEYAGIESGAPIMLGSGGEDDDTMSIVDPDSPIPQLMLKAHDFESVDVKTMDISGSAAYRGLLALNTGLKIVRALFPKVEGAWPQLVDVICSLRDARALPPGLADLDDFADSDGRVLPLSAFARMSQKKLDDYYKGITEKDQKKSWFRMSFFGKKDRKDPDDQPIRPATNSRQLSANQKTLLQVSQRVGLEKIFVFGADAKSSHVKQSINGLLGSIDKFPANDSPMFEQHQAFALELAARALLANKKRAAELLPFFLPKFEAVCSRFSKDAKQVPFPFLVERVVVTILRTSIHLFEVAQVSGRYWGCSKLGGNRA